MPCGMMNTRRSPSPEGVTWTKATKRSTFFIFNSSFLIPQYPRGSGRWSMSYIERPEGIASAFNRRPFLKVAWKVKIGSFFFKDALICSNSSRCISPRFAFSHASSISAQVRPTRGRRTVCQKSPGVHSRTTRLRTLLLIPKLMLFN